MKAVRFSSVVLAIILVVIAFSPVAAKPAAAPVGLSVASASPVQSFLNAASGLPLLDPLGAAGVQNYTCTLVSQNPADYTKMQPRQYFDMSWVIQNTGAVWYKTGVYFNYIGGTKMQTRASSYSLPENISRGKKVTLTVDMEAPKELGGYRSVWGLYVNNKVFCKVTLILAVTK